MAPPKGFVPWNKGKKNVYKKEVLDKWSDKRKGVKPWNKGKKCPQISRGKLNNPTVYTDEIREKISKSGLGRNPWNKGKVGVQVAWNKGTKGVMKSWNKGKKCPQISEGKKKVNKQYTKEERKRMSIAQKKVGNKPPTYHGEEHPCWKGGKSFEPYNKEFNNAFKREIRKRDGYCCQMCNKPSKQTLHVHHINYDKSLTIEENAVSLCKKCHATTNWNRDSWQVFFQKLLSDKYGYVYEDGLPVVELTINNTET